MELSVREVAVLVGRSVRAVRAQVARGELPGVKRTAADSAPRAAAERRTNRHRCALLPPHRIRFRLGEQYDDAMAEEAKQIHDHLGVEWFNKVASRGRVSDVAARAAIDDPAWLAAWRQALLEAHVDVDFVAARNEPPLTTPTR